MSTIKFNAVGLHGASRNLKLQGNELENVIVMLERIVNGLQEDWEGEAARAYAQQYHNLKPNLVKTRHLIEEIAAQLDETLQAAQDLDSTFASKFK